jgi:hypothetical protein
MPFSIAATVGATHFFNPIHVIASYCRVAVFNVSGGKSFERLINRAIANNLTTRGSDQSSFQSTLSRDVEFPAVKQDRTV